MKSFRKTAIAAYCPNSDEHYATVQAYVTPACPGLAVHPRLHRKGWVITHIKSGLAADYVTDRREAKRTLLALSKVKINWTLDQDTLCRTYRGMKGILEKAIKEARLPPIRQLSFFAQSLLDC
jgi:hypothetical protein